MAGFVNIRRDVDDKFYRYRYVFPLLWLSIAQVFTQPRSMPVLLTKIEGKGNGIKTVVPNMSDVARALSRPPTYPTKFFGSELGAQTSVDEKNDRYIVNGAHDANRLRELLDAFIDKFVLCGSCKNPETDLIVTKNELIVRDCKACGERTMVDMRHRLSTYILKNPPKKKNKSSKGGHAEAPVPSGETNGNAGAGENGEDAIAGSDDEMTRRIKAEALELNPQSQLADEGWSADTSVDAVKTRISAVTAGVAGLGLGGGEDESDEDADSPYSHLGYWVKENTGVSAVEIFKKVQELGIEKRHKAVQVLAQTLFTSDILSEIPGYVPIFQKVCRYLLLPAGKAESDGRRW
jgi:translation initiation factor 5